MTDDLSTRIAEHADELARNPVLLKELAEALPPRTGFLVHESPVGPVVVFNCVDCPFEAANLGAASLHQLRERRPLARLIRRVRYGPRHR